MENCKWLLAQDLLCIKGFLLGRAAERENTLSQTEVITRASLGMKTILADKVLCSLLFDVEACSAVCCLKVAQPCLSVLSPVTVLHRRIELM